ncbi:MAG: hypothetical protein KBC17_03580 [Candidatus Pacebacteria bacterium]|nr:hypothetical protein [Candidatus Paceibacterota bacterium]
MKKIVFFLALFLFSKSKAGAQAPTLTVALNSASLSSSQYMVGGIGWFAKQIAETPVDGVYYMAQSVVIFERISYEGDALQGFVGGGFGNKRQTVCGGLSVGKSTHNLKLEKPVWTYSAWVYLQSNNYKWSLWAVAGPHGHFFELGRCVDFLSNKKCENQILITNVKNNIFIAEKIVFPEANLYAYVGIGVTAYPEKEGAHYLYHVDKRVIMPYQSAKVLVEVAYEISPPKDECETCGNLDMPTEYEKMEAEKK